MSTEQRRGIWYALVCYVAWGVFPLYWKALGSVPAIDILANRMAWSMVLVVLLLLLRQDWAWLGPALRNRRIMLAYLGAAALLTANWYIYIYAVNADYVVETSLGYFINPLISVVLAVVFLHERQRAYQWMAIGLAAAGVLFLTWTYGNLPWIALSLALTFGFYGLLKKRAPLESLRGIALEVAFMFVPAVLFLLYRNFTGNGSIGHVPWTTMLLLMGTGAITVGPLLLFTSAARRIPLVMLGIMQYIAPTLQFMLGVAVFHEPFDQTKLIGFSIIWAALLLYWAEGAIYRNRAQAIRAVSAAR